MENAHELEKSLSNVQQAIVDQHYVDNDFKYGDTEIAAIELTEKVIMAFSSFVLIFRVIFFNNY